MAKFRKGQAVKIKRTKQPVKIVDVYEIPRDFKAFVRDMGMGNNLKPSDFSENQYVVDPNDEGDWIGESELVAANSTSTNPVVQNALAACNGINDWWGFRKGDKVRAKYWKNPKAVGIVTGLASMGTASDGNDTFLSVDFPTEKNVSCSVAELTKNSAVATNALPEEEVRKLLLGLAEAKKKYDKFDKEYNRLSDLTAEALGGRTSAWRDINKMERLLDKGNNAGIVGKLMKELHLTIGDITI